MKNKKTKNTAIKKPKFVLTDEAKFYLATKDITDENDDGLFFIASLFLPAKKGVVTLDPYTEIATFDDAESAMIYHDTVAKMAKIHEQVDDSWGIYTDAINKFNGKEK